MVRRLFSSSSLVEHLTTSKKTNGTKHDSLQATGPRREEKAITHPTKRAASAVEREKGTENNSDATKE
eukprot:9073621-Ditylum_brightwellii.AAC.1